MAGKIPSGLAKKKSLFSYNPIHVNDLTFAVESAFSSKFQSVKGQKYSLNGGSEKSLSKIISALEVAC